MHWYMRHQSFHQLHLALLIIYSYLHAFLTLLLEHLLRRLTDSIASSNVGIAGSMRVLVRECCFK